MSDKPLTPRKTRELDLPAAPRSGQPRHLSAASGLVCVDSYLYAVADDELHLGVFRATGMEPGGLIRLFPGELPASKAPRKARKPDLEALMRLPPFNGHPYGALLALGSGSTLNRRRGALLTLDALGAVSGNACAVDLAALFGALDDHFPALNIEGGLVNGDELCLLQRGNRNLGSNALIRYQLAPLLEALGALDSHAGIIAPPLKPFDIRSVDLGGIDATPLCFTDGAALPDGKIVFSAVAENTRDHYNDGPCVAAAIGIMDMDGDIRCMHQLDQPHKIEGIDARVEGDVIRLLLVTDADDAAIPAGLFSAIMELP